VRVTALTRNDEKAAVLRASGVEVAVADLAENTWHGRIEGGADWVVNCVSSGGGGLGGYRHSYVAGMESVRAWARASGEAGTMVYTGSTSVYPQDGGVRINEEATTDGAGERARLLLAAEDIVKSGQGVLGRAGSCSGSREFTDRGAIICSNKCARAKRRETAAST
jgi:nucleoside-diphosphate-sugar epimerase